MEEGVRLALEAIWRAEGEEHARLKDKEEKRLIEESRLKSEEENLWLKAEEEACLVKETRLKTEQEEQVSL